MSNKGDAATEKVEFKEAVKYLRVAIRTAIDGSTKVLLAAKNSVLEVNMLE